MSEAYDTQPMIWIDPDHGALVTPDAMDAMIATGKVTVISRTVDTLTVRLGDCDELDHFRLVRDAFYV